MEVEGEGVHQCDKELIGQATENATNGVEGAEEGTSVLLAASDEVGSDKVLNRTVVNEKEGTLQTDSSNGADQGSANCVLGDDITVSHSDVPNSREGSVETACAHNLGRRINESQDEAVRISGIAADADVGTVLDDHPGDDEQPLKFLSVGILERADTPQQVDQCAAEITCECGKLARINVEGSNSENRGLRYLTCASSDLKHASRKRKRTDMEGCKFFQWIDIPRVIKDERRDQKQKRVRLEQNSHSGTHVCTRSVSKQTKEVLTAVENFMKEPSSSLDEVTPHESAALEMGSSVVDAASRRSLMASEVAVIAPKQVKQDSFLKTKYKIPRPTALVLTSPTKSSLTTTSPTELPKSATTSKSASESPLPRAKARSKVANVVPEKSFRKQYADDRNNPTVDWLVPKRLAFKSLSEVVDRPSNFLCQFEQFPAGTDRAEQHANPKRRKLAAILKSEVKTKSTSQGVGRTVGHGGTDRAVHFKPSASTADKSVTKGKTSAATDPGSFKGVKAKRRSDNSAEEPAAVRGPSRLAKGVGKTTETLESGSFRGSQSKAKRKMGMASNVIASVPALPAKENKRAPTESSSPNGDLAKMEMTSSGNVLPLPPAAAKQVVKVKRKASNESCTVKDSKAKRKQVNSTHMTASDSGTDKLIKMGRGTPESGGCDGSKLKRKQASSAVVLLSSVPATGRGAETVDPASTELGSSKGGKTKKKKANNGDNLHSLQATGPSVKLGTTACLKSNSCKASKAKKTKSSGREELCSSPAVVQRVELDKTAVLNYGSRHSSQDRTNEASGSHGLDPFPAALVKVDKTPASQSARCSRAKFKRKKLSGGGVPSKQPIATEPNARIRTDGSTVDTASVRSSKRCKDGPENSSQRKGDKISENTDVVWIDVPLKSPVSNTTDVKEKRSQMMGENARVYLSSSNDTATMAEKQDHCYGLKKDQGAGTGLLDASQLEPRGETENTQGGPAEKMTHSPCDCTRMKQMQYPPMVVAL